jgi:hypothetical protein
MNAAAKPRIVSSSDKTSQREDVSKAAYEAALAAELAEADRIIKRQGCFSTLYRHGELISSVGASMTEAAFRGNDAALVDHVQEARRILLVAIQAVKELSSTASPRK